MLIEQKSAVCLCNFCGTWLVFQPHRAGEVVNCPECLLETVLYLPEVRSPAGLGDRGLEVRRLHWAATDLGYRHIAGEIANLCDHDLRWVRVQFRLYNGADLPIGSASDCLIGFESGKIWKFRARVFDELAVRASLPRISTEFGVIAMNEPIHGTAVPPQSGPPSPRFQPDFDRGKARQTSDLVQPRRPVHWSEMPKRS